MSFDTLELAAQRICTTVLHVCTSDLFWAVLAWYDDDDDEP